MPTFMIYGDTKTRLLRIGTIELTEVRYDNYKFIFDTPIKYHCVLWVTRENWGSDQWDTYGKYYFHKQRLLVREDRWMDDWTDHVVDGEFVDSFDQDYIDYSPDGCPGSCVSQKVGHDVYYDLFMRRLFMSISPPEKYIKERLREVEIVPHEQLCDAKLVGGRIVMRYVG